MSGDDSKQAIAKTISEPEFAEWITPPRAISLLTSGTALGWSTALGTIVSYLAHGELLARADKVKIISGNDLRDFRRGQIPQHVWGDNEPSSGDSFWKNGLLRWTDDDSRYNRIKYSAFDVRFDPVVISQIVEITAVPGGQETPAKSTGRRGAKRKDWWDHLWIEMIRRIRAKTLNPSSAGDLCAILEEYAQEELGETPGDSTLKTMASNLFKYLGESGGK